MTATKTYYTGRQHLTLNMAKHDLDLWVRRLSEHKANVGMGATKIDRAFIAHCNAKIAYLTPIVAQLQA